MTGPDHRPDSGHATSGDADRRRVAELLGRQPQGEFEVVVRDADGDPVVIRNSPLLADGTPMPTRYWLVAAHETRRIGTLEAGGGVNAAEAAVDPAELAAAHLRYAAERDAAIDPDYRGPRPSGGVGGTRTGVKCLHSHWAWHLAGGDDPVGRWIARELSALDSPPASAGADDNATATTITIGPLTTSVRRPGGSFTVGWGVDNLAERWLMNDDPPRPEDLTNALGTVDDDLDDLDRELGPVAEPVVLTGRPVEAIARLEIGAPTVPTRHVVERSDLEEIFRLAATETADQRRENPGLTDDDAELVLPGLCIALSIARRYRLAEVCLAELR